MARKKNIQVKQIPQFALNEHSQLTKVQPIAFSDYKKSPWHTYCRRLKDRLRYEQNKESIILKVSQWQKSNKEKLSIKSRRWRENNPESDKLVKTSYVTNNKQRIKQRRAQLRLNWSEQKIKRVRSIGTRWRSENRQTVNAKKNVWRNNRLKTNQLYKLQCDISNCIRASFRKKGISKNRIASNAIIGCSQLYFRKYIESLFTDGMTWANKGKSGWHLDHMIPISSAKTSYDLLRLNHHTNFQPLWWYDNLEKSDSILNELVQLSNRRYYEWRIKQDFDFQI